MMSRDLRHDQSFFELLTGSYARLIGENLVPAGATAEWLYEDAPFVVLAHNTDADPKFIYANKRAQACFGYTWEEFLGLPSRLSAEAPDRDERAHILEEVARRGFVRGYRGVRISKAGRRFWIDDGVVWQLWPTARASTEGRRQRSPRGRIFENCGRSQMKKRS